MHLCLFKQSSNAARSQLVSLYTKQMVLSRTVSVSRSELVETVLIKQKYFETRFIYRNKLHACVSVGEGSVS